MKFQINEINDEQLDLMGMNKKMLYELPKVTQDALLNGGRTSLMSFTNLKIPGLQGQKLDAKLSLIRKQDGSVGLRFHPINQVPKNAFQLSEDEIKSLRDGKTNFISKDIIGSEHLITLDRQTNEYVAVKKSEITSPQIINGVYLSNEQKQSFKNGQDIEINGEKIRLNPALELPVENKTNPNKLFDDIKFRHSQYTKKDFLIDLALFSVGLGAVVLLGHLMDVMLNTTSDYYKNLKQTQQQNLQNAAFKTMPEYQEKLKKGDVLSSKEVKEMIERNLDKNIKMDAAPEQVFKPAEQNAEALKQQAQEKAEQQGQSFSMADGTTYDVRNVSDPNEIDKESHFEVVNEQTGEAAQVSMDASATATTEDIYDRFINETEEPQINIEEVQEHVYSGKANHYNDLTNSKAVELKDVEFGLFQINAVPYQKYLNLTKEERKEDLKLYYPDVVESFKLTEDQKVALIKGEEVFNQDKTQSLKMTELPFDHIEIKPGKAVFEVSDYNEQKEKISAHFASRIDIGFQHSPSLSDLITNNYHYDAILSNNELKQSNNPEEKIDSKQEASLTDKGEKIQEEKQINIAEVQEHVQAESYKMKR